MTPRKPGPYDFDPKRFRAGPRRRLLLLTLYGRMEFSDYIKTSPPLDAAYLAAAARAAGHTVSILVITRAADAKNILGRMLRSFQPDVVGMSCCIMNLEACLAAAKWVKEFNSTTHVVLGGPQASASPEICLADPNVDSVAVGEGELTLCHLLKEVAGARLSRVAGLVRRGKSGTILRNPPRPQIRNLDTLPLPALDLYPRQFWFARHDGRIMAPLQTSRGCPFVCTFCASKVVWKRTLRWHSPERVVREMDCLHERYGARHFNLYDANIAIDRRRLLRLCRAITEGRKTDDYTWMCSTRADTVDAELLAAMREAGCRMISYGIESGSQRVLDRAKKGMTLDQYRTALTLTREAGIAIVENFMIGFPTETPEETQATIRLMEETKPDLIGVNIATPMMGTEMFDDALKNGSLREGCAVRDMAGSENAWVAKGRTREELEKIRSEMLRRGNILAEEYLRRTELGPED